MGGQITPGFKELCLPYSPCYWSSHMRTPGNRPISVSDTEEWALVTAWLLDVSAEHSFLSAFVTHSPLHGEVTIHRPPREYYYGPCMCLCPFKILEWLLFFSFSRLQKSVGWMTRFLLTLLMMRKAWKYSFQFVPYIINTDGRDINMMGRNMLKKVLHFSP